MSLRAYARRRGCSAPSVLRAIERRRLVRSLVMVNGVAQIADPDLADQEWAANTDHSRAPSTVKERADQARSGAEPVTDSVTEGRVLTPAATPDVDMDADSVPSLSHAAAAEKWWKAKQARLDYLKDAGHLIDVAGVEQAWTDMVAEVKAALLGLPSKLKGERPETTREQLAALERLVVVALEGLVPRQTAPGKH